MAFADLYAGVAAAAASATREEDSAEHPTTATAAARRAEDMDPADSAAAPEAAEDSAARPVEGPAEGPVGMDRLEADTAEEEGEEEEGTVISSAKAALVGMMTGTSSVHATSLHLVLLPLPLPHGSTRPPDVSFVLLCASSAGRLVVCSVSCLSLPHSAPCLSLARSACVSIVRPPVSHRTPPPSLAKTGNSRGKYV